MMENLNEIQTKWKTGLVQLGLIGEKIEVDNLLWHSSFNKSKTQTTPTPRPPPKKNTNNIQLIYELMLCDSYVILKQLFCHFEVSGSGSRRQKFGSKTRA